MTISITCLDALDYVPTIRALRRTIDTLDGRIIKVYWFSDIPFPEPLGVPVNWIKIARFKNYNDEYSFYTLKICPHVCLEDFNLIIHADGFAVNKSAWTDEFLNYDYIGAVWNDGYLGNGGFSLRSRKLYDALTSLHIDYATKDYLRPYGDDPLYYGITASGQKIIPEDNIICKIHKDTLVSQYGIKFAPHHIANQFSIEHNMSSEWLGRSLGFHGKHGVAQHYGVEL
jgi:hypothetical protein